MLLDLLVLRTSNDQMLAALTQTAREIGPAVLTTLQDYSKSLLADARTMRKAYGITLTALLSDDSAITRVAKDSKGGYVANIAANALNSQRVHRNALHWARRRLASKDYSAEYLALCEPSKPLRWAAGQCELGADADNLDRLFLYRFREKARVWGRDTLFGLPLPPQWLFAR